MGGGGGQGLRLNKPACGGWSAVLRGLQQQIRLSREVNDDPLCAAPGRATGGAGGGWPGQGRGPERRRSWSATPTHPQPPHPAPPTAAGLLLCRVGPEDPSHRRRRGSAVCQCMAVCVEAGHEGPAWLPGATVLTQDGR